MLAAAPCRGTLVTTSRFSRLGSSDARTEVHVDKPAIESISLQLVLAAPTSSTRLLVGLAGSRGSTGTPLDWFSVGEDVRLRRAVDDQLDAAHGVRAYLTTLT